VARKNDEIRQKPEAEQDREKDVGKEYGMPREKCIAKRRIWGRIL